MSIPGRSAANRYNNDTVWRVAAGIGPCMSCNSESWNINNNNHQHKTTMGSLETVKRRQKYFKPICSLTVFICLPPIWHFFVSFLLFLFPFFLLLFFLFMRSVSIFFWNLSAVLFSSEEHGGRCCQDRCPDVRTDLEQRKLNGALHRYKRILRD